MTEAIRAWLNGTRKYEDGVKLYLKYGTDASFKQQLRGSETATKKSRLFQELKAIVKKNVTESPVNVSKTVNNVTVAQQKVTESVVSPINPIAQAAKRDADLLYKQLMDRRAVMLALCPLQEDPLENNTGTVQIRGEHAAEVIRLQYKMDEAYAAYEYARIHGKMPDTETTAPVVNPVKLHQEISNLRKNISRYKRKAELSAIEQSRLQEMERRLPELLNQYENAI